MVTTDPISDMLTRIRNAILVHKTQITVPHSKVKFSIANLLKKEGFLSNVKEETSKNVKNIIITINEEDANPSITSIERVSRPGRRYYSKVDKVPFVKQGRGIFVVSTSKGLMTDSQARKQRLGGELICKVY